METIKILILEHDPNDVELLQYELKKGGLQYIHQLVENREDFKYALNNFQPDIILSDYSLPSFDGLSAFKIANEICPETPFIVVSGTIGDEKAVELIKTGVTDYILKDKIYQITHKIHIAIKEAYDSKQKQSFDRKLQESEQKYRNLFHLSPIPMWVYDPESFKFLNVNKAAIKHYGYSAEEFLNMTIKDIRPPEDLGNLVEVVNQTKKTGDFFQDIFRHLKKNGEIIQVNIQSTLIDFEGKIVRLVLANDITDRMNYIKAIEDQNNKLQEIGWFQSHVVRAPLARMMGLIHYLNNYSQRQLDEGAHEMLNYILNSAEELDEIIREIVKKTEKVKI